MHALFLRAICAWSLCACPRSIGIRGNREGQPARRIEAATHKKAVGVGARVPVWVSERYKHEYNGAIAKVRAWFDVVESNLKKVDYSTTPTCTTQRDSRGEAFPYINAVIHIKNRTWTAVCGDMSNSSRGPPLVEILDRLVPRLSDAMDVYLPFGLHDGVQNVHTDNQNVPVLGPVFHEAYSQVAVPFAMGCIRNRDPIIRAYMNTPVVGWDTYAKTWFKCNQSNATIKKAVFRGKAVHRSKKYGSCCGNDCAPACDFKDNGRLLAHYLGEQHPELFDALVSNVEQFDAPLKGVNAKEAYIDFPDQLCNYQAILNIGNNADWAERLRQSFYGNAVIMMPEHPPHEFFTSFMEPGKSYWPIKADLSDIVEQVTHVVGMENISQQLQAQKAFAAKYLTEEFMFFYNRLVVEEYAHRVHMFKEVPILQRLSAEALANSKSLLKMECARVDKTACPAGKGPS